MRLNKRSQRGAELSGMLERLLGDLEEEGGMSGALCVLSGGGGGGVEPRQASSP